ncbi:MAG TPA: thioredoxin domain-containing protein, partial [Candidatus Ozemobacteraceae bacterium]|nr:thioredoxin domain-containing protein [Candidatus Ozemobacteraceae bacterium]
RERLFAERQKRRRPHRDEKILTDWNGLMIAALAKASWVLAKPDYADAAAVAARQLLATCQTDDGGLWHRTADGDTGIRAHLDDYAFVIWGLLELYEACFDVFWIQKARQLTDYVITHFLDRDHGGFYFTSDLAEPLLVRSKEIYDGATPSGNSVMAANLLRLGRLTGDPSLEAVTEQLFKTFSQKVSSVPMVHAFLLTALDFAIGQSCEVVIVGNPSEPTTRSLLDVARREYHPNRVLVLKNPDDSTPLENVAPYTRPLSMLDNRPTAYVCHQYQCSTPTTDPTLLAEQLRRHHSSSVT